MPSCQVDYPSELPLECVKEIARIVREKRLVQERAALAKHAWVAQGYLQRKLLGEPELVVVASHAVSNETAGTDEEMCELLERVCGHDDQAIGKLPAPVLLLLRWLLEKLLESLVKA